LHSRAKLMNEITWHKSAIWFFIAQKLLFANQYFRKFHKISKLWNLKKKLLKFKIFKKFLKISKIKVKIFIKFKNSKISNFHNDFKIFQKNSNDKIFIKFQNYSKIEPYVIKQLLHLNLINMRFYGAEYNYIELGFVSFNIVVLCSIKPHIDLCKCSNCIILNNIIETRGTLLWISNKTNIWNIFHLSLNDNQSINQSRS
jgi:hypothetical protein